MLAQHLVSLEATILQKAKRCDKVANSPQASNEKAFHVSMLLESRRTVVQKYILGQCFGLTLALNLHLVFHPISGSCSYKLALKEQVQ